MSLLSDEEFAPIAAAAGDAEHLRAKVLLLLAAKTLESEADAIRDDAERLEGCDINPAIVGAFRHRADVVTREADGFRAMLVEQA